MGMYRDSPGDPRADPESDAMLAESFRVREQALRRQSELESTQPVAPRLTQPVPARQTQPAPLALTFGRVLFSVLFIFAGASKLLDVATTAQLITDKIVIPGFLTTYTTQLEGMTGMPMAQMLAIAAGALELICGLMIALNFGARFFAIVLIIFVVAATFYYRDFWNQTGADQKNSLIHALKDLSIVGALFVIAGVGRGPRSELAYPDV
jgi:putative oxidoreductase